MAIKIWIEALRLKTLPAVVVPVLIAGIFAFDRVRERPLFFAWILSFGLVIQVLTNLANDLFDFIKGADSSDRKGPRRAVSSGLISVHRIKLALVFLTVVSISIGVYLAYEGGLPIFILAVTSILLAYGYTAGPWPLAYLGLGDIFVFLFFGPVATGASYYLLTGGVNLQVLLTGCALGFISTAILVVNNIRDFETDKVVGKNTLVVRFGRRFGQMEYALLLLAAALIPVLLYLIGNFELSSCLASLYIIPGIYLIKVVFKLDSHEKLNGALADTGKLLVLYAVLFLIGRSI